MKNLLSLFFLCFAFEQVNAQDLVVLPAFDISELTDSTLTIIHNDRLISRLTSADSVQYQIRVFNGDTLVQNENPFWFKVDQKDAAIDLKRTNTLKTGNKSGTSSWIFEKTLKFKNTVFTTTQSLFLTKSTSGNGVMEVYSIRNYDGNDFKISRDFYDFKSDSLFVRFYLQPLKVENDPHQIIFSISQADEIVLVKKIAVVLSESVNVINFPIGKLPKRFENGGRYTISAEGYSPQKNLIFSFDQITLFIKGEAPLVKLNTGTDDPYFLDTYSDEDFDQLLEISTLFATTAERDLIKNTQSKVNKRNFLNHFWQKREKQESQHQPNFAILKYRMKLASELKLEYLGTKYWRTDRGRVLLQYGFPDNIDKEPFGQNNTPLQIWEFNGIEDGVIFIFIDFNKTGEFRLVHSTKRGEIYNPKYSDDAESGNFNSY